MDDPFIRNYIEDLLKNVRTQVLLKLIKPYTRIRIPFISKVKSKNKFLLLSKPHFCVLFPFPRELKRMGEGCEYQLIVKCTLL